MTKVEIGDIDFGTQRQYDLMKVSRELFRLMMNDPRCDYATLEEMFAFEEIELIGQNTHKKSDSLNPILTLCRRSLNSFGSKPLLMIKK